MAAYTARWYVCALLTCTLANAWLAVTPVQGDGSVAVFEMDDAGEKTKDVLSIPLAPGEDIAPNAFACGRCFCLILATNEAARTSTVYNMSFCLVPAPVLQSKVSIDLLAYNLHCNEGEGDGGNGYLVVVNHTATPQRHGVMQVVGNAIKPLVDISPYVDQFDGNVFAGGTAFCADSMTLWVAIRTQDPTHDTMLTVDLNTHTVMANISIVKPALAAHFADCSSSPPSVGGVAQSTDATGVTTVILGMLSPAGGFTVLDSVKLPAGSALRLAGAVDYLHDPRWNPSEYGALLYTGQQLALPGMLFTSTAGKSPGSEGERVLCLLLSTDELGAAIGGDACKSTFAALGAPPDAIALRRTTVTVTGRCRM